MCLVDEDFHFVIGADINSLPGYAKRTQRRHVPRRKSLSTFNVCPILYILNYPELRNFPVPQPKSLAVGTKAQRPANVPSHLPAFPDPHTYIRTPVSSRVFKLPTLPT